jgi:hypothetical protein
MINPFDLKTALLAKHAQHVVTIHFPITLGYTSKISSMECLEAINSTRVPTVTRIPRIQGLSPITSELSVIFSTPSLLSAPHQRVQISSHDYNSDRRPFIRNVKAIPLILASWHVERALPLANRQGGGRQRSAG